MRLLAALLLAGGLLFSARLAAAGAESLQTMLAGALVPSADPPMLGPITASGRVGWECKPERAAGATTWKEAELPPDAGTR